MLTATDAGRLARVMGVLEEAVQRLQVHILTATPNAIAAWRGQTSSILRRSFGERHRADYFSASGYVGLDDNLRNWQFVTSCGDCDQVASVHGDAKWLDKVAFSWFSKAGALFNLRSKG